MRASVFGALCLGALGAAGGRAVSDCRADENVYVHKASTWTFFRGLSEASSPEDAWRSRSFNDGAWTARPAPFGYGESGLGTDLNDTSIFTDTRMEGVYTCLFLRRSFDVASPASVVALRASINYDDGFVIWINGAELLRQNIEGALGDPVPYNEVANRSHEFGNYETFELSDPAAHLVAGTNVIAAQILNASLGSTDLFFDLELVDPFGPDTRPPAVASVVPSSGSTLRSLTRLEVAFDEIVLGVDAGDLLINGLPASGVLGLGRGPYVFTFDEPQLRTVTIAWAAGHGIVDVATPPNAFAGATWTYTIDPDLPVPLLEINEFLAANRAEPPLKPGLLDEDNEAEDWIELFNPGAAAVGLGGLTLTDDPTHPRKWVFPERTLGPGQYLIVFASGKDRRPASGELHASFKLSSAGEYLGIFTLDTLEPIAEFAPQFPPQRADYSYGRSSGETWGYFNPPTPGAPNGTSTQFEGFVADPQFNPPHGIFEGQGSLSVQVSSLTPGARIFYTLDWTEPSEASGTRYAAPIAMTGTARRPSAVIRAIALKDGYLPSVSVTATYVFIDWVSRQATNPEGFPAIWPNTSNRPGDYEMDPEVTGDAAYVEPLRRGLLQIPALSIVLPMDSLFGAAKGIYANPQSEGILWERAGSAEFMYPDGREGFQINCGLRVQGGASRTPDKSPKHGIRMIFRGDYGPTKLRFPLFSDSPVARFDTVRARANFNNSWIHWDGAQRARAQHIHDEWARKTQLALGQVSSHGIFAHLYLNGAYWGVYNMVERPEASFSADHFGGDKDEYDAIDGDGLEVIDGDPTRAAWTELFRRAGQDLTRDENYQALREYLDVPALIDYMIINLYGANQDWPHHNWNATRRRDPSGLWRFLCWDTERILEDPATNVTGVAVNDSPAYLYARLRTNPEFRLLFADRLHRHFFNGGAMTPAAIQARWMALASEIEDAVVAESARWGDYRRDVHPWQNGPYLLYTRNNQLMTEQRRLLTQYFPNRSTTVLNQFKAISLYPAVNAPEFNQHGGTIQPGFSLTMAIPGGGAGTIYYTTDGSDPRVYGSGAVAPSAAAYAAPVTLNEPARVKARALNGSTWSALTDAFFRIPGPLDGLRLTEIMYHPPDTGMLEPDEYEFIELKNTGAKPLDLTGVRIVPGISFEFPEGAILPPGGFAVVAGNDAAFRERYPGIAFAGFYRGKLSNAGDTMEIVDAAGSAIIAVAYSDLAPWPEEADGWGYSLVPIDPAAAGDPNQPSSWRISVHVGGSPGADDVFDAPTAPRITEEPQDLAVARGESATFRVGAIGTPAPSLRWQRGEVDIPGATGPSYTLEAADFGDHGASFRCVATNAAGTATSRAAKLTVISPEPRFVRGDANVDGDINIADAIRMLSILFASAKSLCDDASDFNDDGGTNIADPVALLSYLFGKSFTPRLPFPECGVDPSGDALGCDSFIECGN